MKKIAFLVDQLVNSGPENVVLDICSNIDKSKYTPIIFSLKDESKNNSIEAKFKDLGIMIVHFSSSLMELELGSMLIAGKIHQKCVELDIDIIHAHTYHPTIIAKNLDIIKKAVTIHNISGEDFVYKKGFCIGSYMKWRFNRSLKKFDRIITISDYMTNYYKNKCYNIQKISNGVSVSNIVQWDESIIRQEMNLKDKYVITILGSVSKRKNVEFALKELQQCKLDFLCLIIGTGDRLSICEEIVRGDNRFRFEGFRNDVQKYLFVSNLYISASLSEGLPLSVLEAISYGVPCVLSDIPPHREIVETMDVPGLSVFPLSENSLCRSLSKVVSFDIDKKSIADRAHALYSSQTMARAYQEIYDTM